LPPILNHIFSFFVVADGLKILIICDPACGEEALNVAYQNSTSSGFPRKPGTEPPIFAKSSVSVRIYFDGGFSQVNTAEAKKDGRGRIFALEDIDKLIQSRPELDQPLVDATPKRWKKGIPG
jgi:hypothetical protein